MRYRRLQTDASKNSRFLEVASVIVRLNHVAHIIVNANHRIM
jgi:hypothetical protein